MEVFSIIIPVYNRPEEIDDLLNSLTRQTYVLSSTYKCNFLGADNKQ